MLPMLRKLNQLRKKKLDVKPNRKSKPSVDILLSGQFVSSKCRD